MEITQEEKETIEKAVSIANRKFVEKMTGLCKLANILYGSWAWEGLGKWFGSAARWMYFNVDDSLLKEAGIRVAERDEMCAGDRTLGRVLLQLDGRDGSVELRYEHKNAPMVTMPGEPEKRRTVTETIDSAAWALKRLDELTAVAIRYVKVLEAVKAREMNTSLKRVEKAKHQIELLKKL